MQVITQVTSRANMSMNTSMIHRARVLRPSAPLLLLIAIISLIPLRRRRLERLRQLLVLVIGGDADGSSDSHSYSSSIIQPLYIILFRPPHALLLLLLYSIALPHYYYSQHPSLSHRLALRSAFSALALNLSVYPVSLPLPPLICHITCPPF